MEADHMIYKTNPNARRAPMELAAIESAHFELSQKLETAGPDRAPGIEAQLAGLEVKHKEVTAIIDAVSQTPEQKIAAAKIQELEIEQAEQRVTAIAAAMPAPDAIEVLAKVVDGTLALADAAKTAGVDTEAKDE